MPRPTSLGGSSEESQEVSYGYSTLTSFYLWHNLGRRGVYYNFILLPRLQRMDASTQRSVTKAVTQIMGPLLGISAIVTIVSGGIMLVQLRAEHGANLLATGWGISMIIGTFTSILTLVLVFAIELPTGNTVEKLAASIEGREPTQEESRALQQLSNRVVFIGRLGTVLLLIALASMALARFV